jgi:electron transfer flavoprotein alpha subunit
MRIAAVAPLPRRASDEDAAARMAGALLKAAAVCEGAETAFRYMTDGAEASLPALEALSREYGPDILLLPAGSAGTELAARLSARTGAACSSDALDFEAGVGGELLFSKDIYSGNLRGLFRCETPMILTVRPDGFEAATPFAETEIVRVRAERNGCTSAFRNPSFCETEAETGIGMAEILVICGAGFASKDNAAAAKTLAEAMGGLVAGTRPAAIGGGVPLSRIVGISGTRVSPRLCLVLGASGARAFAAGIKDSGTVLGVNTDAEAPLFKLCDAGAVCEAGEFARALTEILRAEQEMG